MAVAKPMVPPEFTETVEMVFHNVEYLLTVAAVKDETICIEVEQKRDGARWRGDFSARYIEDITAKTGNYKKYPVFVRMLLSAITEESDSVFVDLLTYSDLEMLKARKQRGGASQAPAPGRNTPNNKRYLILTYAAEFDRVHYPLPLVYEDHPDPDALKATIRRLREELDQKSQPVARAAASRGQHADPAELRRVLDENNRLRAEVRKLESLSTAGTSTKGHGDANVERLMQEKKEIDRELRLCRKERDLLAQRCDQRENELENMQSTHRRALSRKQKEYEGVCEELARRKESERELRLKCRDLTNELDALHRNNRRGTTAASRYTAERKVYTGVKSSGYGSRGPSPRSSRGPSPTGYRRQSPASSRGPTPPSSRPTSASRATRATSATRDTKSRPSSAPLTRPRFDPTAYVQERAERIAAARAQRSGHSSGRSSPAGSRPSSRGPSPRGRGPSPRAAGPATAAAPASVYSRGASPRSGSQTDRAGPGRAMQPGRGRPAYGQSRGGSLSARDPPARARSPGTITQDVKSKLSEFAGVQNQAPNPPRKVVEDGKYDDASAEIADIDSRLHALQNFLRAAKTAKA